MFSTDGPRNWSEPEPDPVSASNSSRSRANPAAAAGCSDASVEREELAAPAAGGSKRPELSHTLDPCHSIHRILCGSQEPQQLVCWTPADHVWLWDPLRNHGAEARLLKVTDASRGPKYDKVAEQRLRETVSMSMPPILQATSLKGMVHRKMKFLTSFNQVQTCMSFYLSIFCWTQKQPPKTLW